MIEQQALHDRITCIISDTLMYFSEDVANYLKLPIIVLRASNGSSTIAYRNIPRLHAEGLFPLQGKEILRISRKLSTEKSDHQNYL